MFFPFIAVNESNSLMIIIVDENEISEIKTIEGDSAPVAGVSIIESKEGGNVIESVAVLSLPELSSCRQLRLRGPRLKRETACPFSFKQICAVQPGLVELFPEFEQVIQNILNKYCNFAQNF